MGVQRIDLFPSEGRDVSPIFREMILTPWKLLMVRMGWCKSYCLGVSDFALSEGTLVIQFSGFALKSIFWSREGNPDVSLAPCCATMVG